MDMHKKVPIRWLPQEVIKSGHYTYKSDVFAFEIMAWEITEDGKEPYPGMKVMEVAVEVPKGYRMKFNAEVNVEFGAYILANCWENDPQSRQPMKDIVKWMKTYVKEQGGEAGKSGIHIMSKIGKLKRNSKEHRSGSNSKGGSTSAGLTTANTSMDTCANL